MNENKSKINEPFMNKDYVVSIKNTKVKITNYEVEKIEMLDNEQYEFLFKYTTHFKELTSYNTKRLLTNVYNIGKWVHEHFTYDDALLNSNNEYEIIKRNLFLRAKYNTDFECAAQPKSFDKQIKDALKLNNITEENYKKAYSEQRRKIEKAIYVRNTEELFRQYNVTKSEYNTLIKLICNFVKAFGIYTTNNELEEQEQSLFSIILLSHKVYLFIESGGKKQLEVNITQTLSKDMKCEMMYNTTNDLIYSLAINYFAFNRNGYIICEVCGQMAEGNQKKKTCSERCKKIRNKSYKQKSI